jgi:YihY family inner membrane protein
VAGTAHPYASVCPIVCEGRDAHAFNGCRSCFAHAFRGMAVRLMNFAERGLRRVDRWQQGCRPAAFVFGVMKKYGDDNAGQLAASLTHSGFVTFFPLLLVLATVLGLVAAIDPGLRHSVDSAVAAQFPLIGNQLTGNVGELKRSSLIGLIFGLLVVTWGTSGLAQSAMFAMAQVWNVPGPQRPGYLQRLGRAGLFLLGLLIGVVATTGLASLSAFGHHNPVIIGGADALAVVVNVGMYAFAFRVLTPKGIPSRNLMPGAIVAGILWTALQAGGALVIKHYLHSESVYHIFAIVLALIAWIYLLVEITLYSAEINVVAARRLYPRSMLQPPLTEADRAALALQPLQNQRREEQHIQVTFTDRQDGQGVPDSTPQEPGDVSPPAAKARRGT